MKKVIFEGWRTQFSLLSLLLQHQASATIDVNLNELEYLAARLDPFECRRLVAALHYESYELPKSLAAAERNVDEEIPCMRQLLHWNSSPAEGRGKTHEVIVHRLRQLNRNDLADWLGKMSFKQLGKDLDRALSQSLKDADENETDITHALTTESFERQEDEDSWSSVDTVLMAILLGLLGTLLTLICTSIVYKLKVYCRGTKYKKLEEAENSYVTYKVAGRRKTRGIRETGSSGDVSENGRTDTDTDMDFN